MSRSHKEERFPDDLQEIVDVLRDERPALSPLELDRVKLRAMSAARHSTSPRKGSSMRSRLTTLLAAAFLVLGTGGALALSDGGGSSGGSASFHEYRCAPHSRDCAVHTGTRGSWRCLQSYLRRRTAPAHRRCPGREMRLQGVSSGVTSWKIPFLVRWSGVPRSSPAA